MASLVTQMLKHLPAMQETWVRSLGWEDPLEKEMATHSSILAWKIPWMEKPGRLQSMELQRVGHDWVASLSFFYGLHRIKLTDIQLRDYIMWNLQTCLTSSPRDIYRNAKGNDYVLNLKVIIQALDEHTQTMAALMSPCSKLHHSWAHETASLSSWGFHGRAYCEHPWQEYRKAVLPEGIARERKETRNYRKRLDAVSIAKWLLWTRCSSLNFQWILTATLW